MSEVERTQVAIIGAGPAGMVLSRLLAALGIECVVLEARSRHYVEHRLRAGVLEHPSVELLRQLGVADRLDCEALVHRGIELAFHGRRHRLDFVDLTGKAITVYGQQEVVKDLIAAGLAAGGDVRFEVSDVEVIGVETERPAVRFVHDGEARTLECDVIAGCDGFRGVCRPSIPPGRLSIYEHEYPFAWLGILAQAPPTTDELIYANHDRGFALYSMRSPEITRLYLQVAPDEDLGNWPEERVWDELAVRLPTGDDFTLATGTVLEKGITAMRSFVAAPMRYGRLMLAGDAAHIVPPTGAKGMNLAIADVAILAEAVERFYAKGDDEVFDQYADACMARVWRVQQFSWSMTSMLHRFDDDAFRRPLQLSELAFLTSSRAAATALAENYVGLPFARLEGPA